jgi:hypothetical protein
MPHHFWTLKELAAWAGTPGFRPLWNRVRLFPHSGMWPQGDSMQACVSIISKALSAHEHPLFQALCLAGAALTPDLDSMILSTLQAWTSPRNIGLPLSWSGFNRTTWQRIPLLLADEGTDRAELIWALAGKAQEHTEHILPAWAKSCMEPDTLAALAHAAGLEQSAGTSLIFWPIIDFTRPEIQIRGSSLGLPALLGFYAVKQDIYVPNVAATGSLDVESNLLPVSHLEAKAKAARASGIQGLIFPCTGPRASLATAVPDLELLPVSDLPTARTLWQIYAPGRGAALIQSLQAMGSPCQTISSLLSLPEHAVRFLDQEYGLVRRTMRLVFSTQDIHSLGRIMDLIWPQDNEQSCTQALLQPVLDSVQAKDLDVLYSQSPELCLRLCRMQLMRCRHQGRLTAWKTWETWMEGHDLEEEIACSDQGETKLIMLLAERIVQDQHNSFCFDPHILDTLGPWVQEAFCAEQERFKRRLQRAKSPVHRALGCFYGTMAQHFGFCGPKYLDLCRNYVHLAQNAFGQGERADFGQDWRREFSYLVYAFLDAGDMAQAKDALLAYLECLKLADFPPKADNPFQHAAYVRFLADSGQSLPQAYAQYWVPRLGQVPAIHPWQLWAVNFGRLMPDKMNQKACWEKAVNICTAIPGETTKAMLLLPLSLLSEHEPADRSWLEDKTQAAMDTIRTSLHTEHFAPLLQTANWEHVLSRVRTHQRTLFPFSYR